MSSARELKTFSSLSSGVKNTDETHVDGQCDNSQCQELGTCKYMYEVSFDSSFSRGSKCKNIFHTLKLT